MKYILCRPTRVGQLVYGLYDNSWYRAEVLNLSEQQANICFIDYGNCELVPFTNLRQATSLCKDQPMFSVQCELVKVNSGPVENAIDLFNKLIHKDNPKELNLIYKGRNKAQAVVDFLTDQGEQVSVLISKFLEETKSPPAVMAEDIKRLTLPADGSPVTGVIMFINSLSSFFVLCGSELEQVMKEVADICSKDHTPYMPKVGEMVFGQFSDDQCWYRAKVLEVSGEESVLLYADFGNKEIVGKNAMRKFNPDLSKYPLQSLHCKLAAVSKDMETNDILQVFANFINQQVQIQLKGTNNADPVEVDLLLGDGSNVNQTIVALFSDEASSADASVNPAATSSDSQSSPSPATPSSGFTPTATSLHFQDPVIPFDGSKLHCSITDYQNLNSFHLQINRNGELESLISLLEGVGEDKTPYKPEVGEDVCAIYSIDEKWYRARVLEKMEDNSYVVYFVDFGNANQVTSSEIRKLKPAYVQLPCLAVHCRLQAPDLLSDDLTTKFGELVSSGNLSFQPCSKENGMYVVKMFTGDGVCINDVLLGGSSRAEEVVKSQNVCASDLEVAKKPQIPDFDMPLDGTKQPFLVTNIDSLHSFYAHFYTEESREKFSGLLEKINTHCSSITQPYSPEVGEVVCCQFSLTEQWLRAEVLQVQGSSYVVQFVDYGNVVSVQKEEIRKADDSFLHLPKQAIRCKLHISVDPNSPKLNEIFEEMVRNSLSYIRALSKDKNVYCVQMSTDEVEDITERLKNVAEDKNAAVNFVPRVLPVNGQREACVFVDLSSLKSFYVNLVGPPHREDLGRLEEEIATFCQSVNTSYRPQVGEVVLTKYSLDGKFYRAKVLEVIDEALFKVLFIDFGNTDLVADQDIREMNESFLSVPNFGIHCSLSGIEENEPMPALQQFAHLTANTLLEIEVVGVKDDLHEVIIFNQNGENINKLVLQTISSNSSLVEPAAHGPSSSGDSPGGSGMGGLREVEGSFDSSGSVNIRLGDMSRVEPTGEEMVVMITDIQSPEEIFCQLVDQEGDLFSFSMKPN